MTSTFHQDDSSRGVAECLKEAGVVLQASLERLEYGEPLPTTTKPSSDAAVTMQEDDEEEDDLAAAFFAQQAKKQQEETRIPIDEWAKTIFAHHHHHHHAELQPTTVQGTALPRFTNATNDTTATTATTHQEIMVNELFPEFKKGMTQVDQ